jgi:hypothetical protein
MHTEACLMISPISFDIGFALSGTLFSFHDRMIYLKDLAPALDWIWCYCTYATISNISTMTTNRRKTMVRTVKVDQEI